MTGFIKNITKPSILITVLACLVAPSSWAGESCSFAVEPVLQKMQRMQEQLMEAETRELYRDVVRNRYDEVSTLLQSIDSCEESVLSGGERKAMKRIKASLVSLQSSSRTSAFTKFADWVDARQRDLTALRNVETNQGEAAGAKRADGKADSQE